MVTALQRPRVNIGTSGWSYPSGYGKWKGVVYPKRWSGDELAYYAERFPAVEVNTTFYRVPSVATVRGWVERTPEGFDFAVKLFRKFTHPEFYAREEGQSPEITPEDIAVMRLVLDALAERQRLGAVLVQYPEFFTANEESVASLVRTLSYFRSYPLAVELRHRSWQTIRTRELLAHCNAGFVRIDEPYFSNLDEAFAPPGAPQYWRFHGRNRENWRKPGAGAHRYDYLYSGEEIDGFVDTVESGLSPSRKVNIFFNNHVAGKAVVNALMLAYGLKIDLPYQKCSHLAEQYPELKSITGEVGGQLTLE